MALRWLVLGLAVACGGDDGVDPVVPDAGTTADAQTPAPTPLTVADLCGADGAYARFIDSALRCSPELELLFGVRLDGSDLDAACDAQLAPYVDDATVELGSRDDLEVCLAALDSLDCTAADIRTIDACDPVLLGTIEAGGACEVDAQCAGDAYCDVPADGGCGSCTERQPDGAGCDNDGECAGGRCAAGSCRQVATEGMSCAVDDDCAGTLRCDPTGGICELPPDWKTGDPCVPDTTDCLLASTDLFCSQATSTCQPFAEIGDTCANGAAVCNFLQYEICDGVTGLCTAPQTSPLAGSCGFFAGRRCQQGLICSQPLSGGTCVDPAVGSTCNAAVADFSCGFLLECQPDNTCQFASEYSGTCP